MKIYFLLFIMLLYSLGINAQSLTGTIADSATHQPTPGAVVYIPQLNLGATADAKGNYKITPLPNGTYEVQVSILGHATVSKSITIKGDATLDFIMSVSSCSCPYCVVITALGNVTNTQRSPVPVSIVTHDDMLQETSSTVIDAIATRPGIAETTEGPGTTKPQINGLGFNRVLTLFDGEREEDFEWGDDHGILIDPYAVYDAEIIRGAASLQYGANAEAGVISFKTEPFAESGIVQGSILTEYQTNNGYIGTSEDIGGNNNGFVWGIRASEEEAHCYSDPKDGYVWGSAYVQQNARATIGWDEKWGYSRLSVSFLHRQIEVPDGNRDSATGQFEFDAPQNGQIYPTRANFFSYDPNIASCKILDEDEVWWQNSFNVGAGKIAVDVGFTESIHHDIDTGTVGEGNMGVHDIPYSLNYQVQGEKSGLKFTGGVNGMYEFESNDPEPPAPYIGDFEIPNYTDFDIGGFAILEWDHKNLTLSGGLRYDFRNMIGQSMYLLYANTPEQEQVPAGTPGAITQFLPFNNTYTGPSGSIGASYQLPQNNYIKINFAKSYREPAINELTSNNLNIGSNAFQLGNIDLKAEQGYEVDLAYGNNGRDISFEADGFYNYINNFIFADRLAAKGGGDSILSGYPVFQFVSNTAIVAGVSGYFNIHPADTKWIEIDNGFTYTYSYLPNQTDSTNHVPWTPAPRLTSQVKFILPDTHSILSSTYIEIGLEHDWAQNNIYSALYTELPSSAYTLYNAGIGTNFVSKKTRHVLCSLFINCTNLMNIAYVNHLNLAQYFQSYNGRIVTVTQQSQGIYNMGRNIGFKLFFPIGGHKVSDTESGINDHE